MHLNVGNNERFKRIVSVNVQLSVKLSNAESAVLLNIITLITYLIHSMDNSNKKIYLPVTSFLWPNTQISVSSWAVITGAFLERDALDQSTHTGRKTAHCRLFQINVQLRCMRLVHSTSICVASIIKPSKFLYFTITRSWRLASLSLKSSQCYIAASCCSP
jgi:hypothetical protein